MKSQIAVGLFTLLATSYAFPASGSVSSSLKNEHVVTEIAFPLPAPNATNITISLPKLPALNVSGFAYVSCQTDSRVARVLKDKSLYSANMTSKVCSSFCTGYQYFGLEYKSECYCGFDIAATSLTVQEPDCWMACSGDSTERCGGTDRVSVFKATAYTPPIAAKPPTVPKYAYRGCYVDAVGSRTLKGEYFYGEDMTTMKCAGLCGNSTYFGTEYGGECYCSSLFPTGAKEVKADECSVGCKGNKTQACGGGNRLSVYWRLP